jgi:hypothetical protein
VSAAGFAAVRDHVVASPDVAERLAAIADRDELCAAVLALASATGADVTESDLDDALVAGTRRTLERWL